ncbi:MAG: FAD-dependent monooxygenase [Burkholderiaceae bacterium]|nr:FAD-dependent monooxygenase [Burkholderiaceae bacterium]
MTNNPLWPRALIVGGGIGGLAAAMALRRAGCDVDLVEIKPAWAQSGVGIIQPANALRALDTLGVAQDCLAAGFAYDGYDYMTADGTPLNDFAGPRAAPHLPAYNGILRSRLHDILLRGARAAGARLQLGTTVVELYQTQEGAHVTLSDGTQRDYALVVAADGIYSPLRHRLHGQRFVPTATGQSVWRLTLPRPPAMRRGVMMLGESRKAGFIPLNDDSMYLLLVTQEAPGVQFSAEELPRLLLERLAGFGGLVEHTRQYVQADSAVVYRPLEVVTLDAPWHTGRVVFIGDAAHASTPHLGQGAAMAIEDAVVLGELVGAGADPARLGDDYMGRRHARAREIQDASFTIGEYEQGRRPGLDLAALLQRTRHRAVEPI